MDTRPNILLIMTDEMRGDCIGAAGHPDVKTPHIDTLAAYGVRFENACSACPTCVPARAALFTGMSQKHHMRVGYEDRIPWNYEHTLAGELTKAGYQTQCCGKMHVHPLRSLQGFMSIDLHDGYLHEYRKSFRPFYDNQYVADDYMHFLKNQLGSDADIIDTGLGCNSWVSRPWPYAEKLHPTNWATDRSLDFLRRRDHDKPFFLMTSYVRPHAPYDAPQAFFDMYRGKDLRPPFVGDWDDLDELEAKHLINCNSTGPKDRQLIYDQMVGYYACITHVDYQIGRILQTLDDYDLARNTVILFVSDHGEMLSDHAIVRKSRPYHGSIHVPLIISGSVADVPVRNYVNSSLVELRDVMPTLLDFAGADIPDSVDGISLKGGVISRDFDTGREYIHGEHTLDKLNSNQFIVTKTDKYIWYSKDGREQYFNLAIDPYETKNLIGDKAYRAEIDRLRALLIFELKGRPEGYSDGKQLFAGRETRVWLGDTVAEP